jgi:hypothetical protein
VYLRRRGKHQWEQWTPEILLVRLARRGRQHNGVAAAKMVARVWARFGWVKPLGMTPYIGKLVPITRKRCELQSYVIFILIRSRFSWRSWGKEGFSSRWWRKLGSDSVHREDDGVLAGLAWATSWATRREKGGSQLGHKAERLWPLLGSAQKIERGRKDLAGWASIKVPTHGQ